jgi:hypothetical protein
LHRQYLITRIQFVCSKDSSTSMIFSSTASEQRLEISTDRISFHIFSYIPNFEHRLTDQWSHTITQLAKGRQVETIAAYLTLLCNNPYEVEQATPYLNDGFRNDGNKCFFTTMSQALLHVIPLSLMVIPLEGTSVAKTWCETMALMNNPNLSRIERYNKSNSKFEEIYKFRSWRKTFGSEQSSVIDALNYTLRAFHDNAPCIYDMFAMNRVMAIHCNFCNHNTSVRTEGLQQAMELNFSIDLLQDIDRVVTMADMLRTYLLQYPEGYKCTCCGRRNNHNFHVAYYTAIRHSSANAWA